jgi:hypothetical protein
LVEFQALLAEAEAGAGGKLKPGRYLVEVDDAHEKESKKGDPNGL